MTAATNKHSSTALGEARSRFFPSPIGPSAYSRALGRFCARVYVYIIVLL